MNALTFSHFSSFSFCINIHPSDPKPITLETEPLPLGEQPEQGEEHVPRQEQRVRAVRRGSQDRRAGRRIGRCRREQGWFHTGHLEQ